MPEVYALLENELKFIKNQAWDLKMIKSIKYTIYTK